MPQFVNVGAFGWRGWQGTKVPSQRNCEFCTAAGAVDLILGHVAVTSADASKYANLPDNVTVEGGYQAQALRISKFVMAMGGRGCGWSGRTEKPYADVAQFMSIQIDGTVFAVYMSGKIVNGGPSRGHWLNAMQVGNTVRWFDFQTNREYKDRAISGTMPSFLGGLNPSTCTQPFLGVETQLAAGSTASDMHSSDPSRQVGMFKTAECTSLALAFPPLPR